MRYIYLLLAVFTLFASNVHAQSNTGTPYSFYGIGILPENQGPYIGMGGVTAGMRDNNNINFLNPASYTALDSNRFYFQFALNGEYVSLHSGNTDNDYKVGQNSALSFGLRLAKNLYASFGFTERSDIGYDVIYVDNIIGDEYLGQYIQHLEGEGGLNELYFGLGWKFKNLSIGANIGYEFGKIEQRQTLNPILSDSYIIQTSDRTQIRGIIVTPAIQYTFQLPEQSSLTLGGSMNFKTFLNARKEFFAKAIGQSGEQILDHETIDKGRVIYPLRYTVGGSYINKDKWQFAADYTYQQMSDYQEFNEFQDFNNYHKIAAGISLTPSRYGRRWVQRNTYSIGSYFVKSHIEQFEKDINTFAMTVGTTLPFRYRGRELHLGVAGDFGVRGVHGSKLIQERFAKIRLNIAIKETWFIKRKIN